MDDIVVSLEDAQRGRELFEPICAVYDEVFSAPPLCWRDDESALHRGRLSRLLNDPTFGLAIAVTGRDTGGQASGAGGAGLIGFAYGFTVPPETRRWATLTGGVDPETAREWPGRTFSFFDFGVRRPFRGRGIGKALHDLLLSSRAEERATLSTEPVNVNAKRLYERWGWRMVGQSEGAPGDSAPLFDCYVRDTLGDLRQPGQAARP